MSHLESLAGMRARAVGEISERRRRGRFDLDGLNSCAGSHRWGYKDPTGAAWEFLEEAVESLLEDGNPFWARS